MDNGQRLIWEGAVVPYLACRISNFKLESEIRKVDIDDTDYSSCLQKAIEVCKKGSYSKIVVSRAIELNGSLDCELLFFEAKISDWFVRFAWNVECIIIGL